MAKSGLPCSIRSFEKFYLSKTIRPCPTCVDIRVGIHTHEFSDGEETGVKHYRFNGTTDEQLKNFIRSEAKKLTKVKESDYSMHVGKEMDIADEVIEIPEPTPEEIAQAAWFKDWYKLDSLIHLVDNGILNGDESVISDLQASLKKDQKNSYLEDI